MVDVINLPRKTGTVVEQISRGWVTDELCAAFGMALLEFDFKNKNPEVFERVNNALCRNSWLNEEQLPFLINFARHYVRDLEELGLIETKKKSEQRCTVVPIR